MSKNDDGTGEVLDHDRIQELLAAHALHALDGPELEQAEDLLTSHVPGCVACRRTTDAFQAVAGDLALAVEPRSPPRRLAARLSRSTAEGRSHRWVTAGVAAAIVVLVGLGGWTAHLTSRVSSAERRQANATKVLSTVAHPQSQVVPLSSETSADRAPVQLTAAFVPGRTRLYLFGSVGPPLPDHTYQVWLFRNGVFRSAATFVPDGELVLLELAVDPLGYDGLLITEEPGRGSERPSARRVGTASL